MTFDLLTKSHSPWRRDVIPVLLPCLKYPAHSRIYLANGSVFFPLIYSLCQFSWSKHSHYVWPVWSYWWDAECAAGRWRVRLSWWRTGSSRSLAPSRDSMTNTISTRLLFKHFYFFLFKKTKQAKQNKTKAKNKKPHKIHIRYMVKTKWIHCLWTVISLIHLRFS